MLKLLSKIKIEDEIQYIVEDEESKKKHIITYNELSEQIKLGNIKFKGNKIIAKRNTFDKLKIVGENNLEFENVSKSKNNYKFKSNVFIGKNLDNEIKMSDSLNERYFVKEITNYINSNSVKLLGIYGLRRTGKTVGMFKAIRKLLNEGKNNVAYIVCNSKLKMRDLLNDIDILVNAGYRYIFIDEITYIRDFINDCSILANYYTMSGIRLIITGTNSFGLLLASNEELFDRITILDVTYISYKEYKYLFGKKTTIKDYINSGGLLTDNMFYNINTFNNYYNTAIYDNLAYSIVYYEYKRERMYLGIPRENLRSALIKILDIDSKNFTVKSLLKRFKSRDLSSALQILDKKYDISSRINSQEISEELRYYLSIKNWDTEYDMKSDMSKIGLETVEKYLQAIGVIYPFCGDNIYIIPGLRTSKCKELINILVNRDFDNLESDLKEKLKNTIINDVEGLTLEDIILYNTIYLVNKKNDENRKDLFEFDKYNVSKERFVELGNKEIDMIVYNSENNSCIEYEIKHSSVVDTSQYKWLIDKEVQRKIIYKYGNINKRVVLYLGESKIVNDVVPIEYKNIEEYLLQLEDDLDKFINQVK